ncbi:hypothetical protein Q3G72_035419 [Acer saccharum]|nr:hypothetical protein Q3G72_035419 [Acer saccharum]
MLAPLTVDREQVAGSYQAKGDNMSAYLEKGHLYRKGKSLPLLRCLHPDDAKWALKEVHSSGYGDHSGGDALAHRVLRMGYFWPTLHEDARLFARSSDLIGPLPAGVKQAKYVVVAIDYFTRWVEAEPLTNITEVNTTAFIKKNVVCRFGVLKAIITDLGKQFDNYSFRDYCEDLKIECRFASSLPRSPGGKKTGVALRAAAYQQKIARCFNKGVRIRSFKEGDLVLRKVTQNTRRCSDGVLALNWEGPYLIKANALQSGVQQMDEAALTALPRYRMIHDTQYLDVAPHWYPGTQYPALGTPYPVLGTRYPPHLVLSTPHLVPGIPHLVLSTLHSIPRIMFPAQTDPPSTFQPPNIEGINKGGLKTLSVRLSRKTRTMLQEGQYAPAFEYKEG